MKLNNLERANKIKTELERIERARLQLCDRKTSYVRFIKGGPNVDVTISDEILLERLQEMTLDFFSERENSLLRELETL